LKEGKEAGDIARKKESNKARKMESEQKRKKANKKACFQERMASEIRPPLEMMKA